eukprot:COSAG02_NODE_54670_length_295_cov_0.357143_1_plen_35_part_01
MSTGSENSQNTPEDSVRVEPSHSVWREGFERAVIP